MPDEFDIPSSFTRRANSQVIFIREDRLHELPNSALQTGSQIYTPCVNNDNYSLHSNNLSSITAYNQPSFDTRCNVVSAHTPLPIIQHAPLPPSPSVIDSSNHGRAAEGDSLMHTDIPPLLSSPPLTPFSSQVFRLTLIGEEATTYDEVPSHPSNPTSLDSTAQAVPPLPSPPTLIDSVV